MPLVQVSVWEGFGAEKAKAVMQGVTQVFVGLGIPAQAVEVVVQEVPKTHWGRGGEPACDWGRPAAEGSAPHAER